MHHNAELEYSKPIGQYIDPQLKKKKRNKARW